MTLKFAYAFQGDGGLMSLLKGEARVTMRFRLMHRPGWYTLRAGVAAVSRSARPGWSPRPAQPRHPRRRGGTQLHHKQNPRQALGAVRRQPDGVPLHLDQQPLHAGQDHHLRRHGAVDQRPRPAWPPGQRRARLQDAGEYVNLDSLPPGTPGFGGPYFGETIGRYANRIGGASFKLNGRPTRCPSTTGPTPRTAGSSAG